MSTKSISEKEFHVCNNGSTAYFPMENIVEDFELQYNENHETVIVKVGETDVHKECCSHFDKVGLINVCKAAISRGEDPLTCFAKREPGVPVSVPINATMDDINDALLAETNKKAEIANSLGVSVDELDNAIKSGSISDLIEKASKAAPAAENEKEGVE